MSSTVVADELGHSLLDRFDVDMRAGDQPLVLVEGHLALLLLLHRSVVDVVCRAITVALQGVCLLTCRHEVMRIVWRVDGVHLAAVLAGLEPGHILH